ncbi:MAG: tRNA uridine-5-carboxymethylaminomethyl(34) synthesis enzyme MnmG [Bacteroidales bacterium]|jgi:tRNA uridine 5-carboxymethylaminomethyl modification enzyme|nr:tRNA uridine-5-carboxymethylaminomethyl(34) synthesis enzyme MnmG [Bacteroidales bacterium]
MLQKYDVIVVGAGHAGCEAAAAAARLGSQTLLITMDMTKMAAMSCNPAVGGIAKGQIVREIDALGGYMGVVTDMSSIQFRMLNKSKGPAMWSPRSQADKAVFSQTWREILEHIPNLDLWQDSVTSLLFETNRVVGVRTMLGIDIFAQSVVLTNGTFLNGLLHVGRTSFSGGRIGEPASFNLSDQLRDFGFEVDRMKTGTPARIDGRTIDFSKCVEQPGDVDRRGFSYLPNVKNELPQLSCYMTYTNPAVHTMLKSGFNDSPMYNGTIQSLGPRYCPSIETKLVTFADKEQHQLFLEPEGAHTHEYYVNGFSSSLPAEVQYKALQLVPGLEHCKIYRPGYAIEYDFFQPTQLHLSLETKHVENLFFAGQINGTTGYEEAAAQGLIAGINAHRKTRTQEAFVLKRDEAYIGVLIDDLVSKGVNEPYRMFTSRAEFRILLRQDNADLRLTPKGIELGLVDDYRKTVFENKYNTVSAVIDYISSTNVTQEQANPILEKVFSAPIKQSMKISALVARPNVLLADFNLPEELYAQSLTPTEEIFEAAEIAIKYAGYIEKEKQLAEKIARLDYIRIKDKIPYATIMSLSTEARQKLTEINPETIGQASRISGVSPADVSVLLVYMGR